MDFDTKYCYVYRKFINEEAGTAYIYATISALDYTETSENWAGQIDAYLEIKDCDRQISLDFCYNAWDKKETEKIMDKLDKLVGTITEFKRKLIERQEETIGYKAKFDQKKEDLDKKIRFKKIRSLFLRRTDKDGFPGPGWIKT